MRGSLRAWSACGLVAALAACSNIIGISDIEIDKSLDGAEAQTGGDPSDGGSGGNSSGGNSSGGNSSGGNSSAGTSVVPQAGEAAGGTAGSGEAGTSSGGSPIEPGDGGAGGVGPGGCQVAKDCDDEIACTTDTCLPSGECQHTADDTACTTASGKCTSCQVGIGCVDSEPVEKTLELLQDGSFDEQTGDWLDYSDVDVVSADAAAQSGTHSVHITAAPADAEETRFSDLSQLFHVPAGTVKLTASGWYKKLWAPEVLKGRPRTDEYVTLTLFSEETNDAGNYTRYLDFESWDGEDAQQTSWKAFTYDAPRSALNKVLDLDITLDLVAETWDTQYYFDSLSLKAQVCK